MNSQCQQKQIGKQDLYYCYNPLKKKFFCKKMHLWYITNAIHPVSLKRYWIFLKGDELDNAFKEWRKYQEQRFKK